MGGSEDVLVEICPEYGHMYSLSSRSLFVKSPLCAWLMHDCPIPTPYVGMVFSWYSLWSDRYVSMCRSVSMLYIGLLSAHVLVCMFTGWGVVYGWGWGRGCCRCRG